MAFWGAIAQAGGLNTNNLSELTTDEGVTIEEVLVKDGTIGIVTSSPEARLDVRNSGTEDILNLSDDSTEVFTVLDGGNVGIGTESPQEKLHVVGNLVV